MAQRSISHPSRVRCLAVSSKEDVIVTGCDDGSVRVWDAKSLKLVGHFVAHTGSVLAVAIARTRDGDGDVIATGGADGVSCLLHTSSGEAAPKARLQHSGAVFAVALSNDGKSLATASNAQGKGVPVLLWNVGDGTRKSMQLRGIDAATAATAVALPTFGTDIAAGIARAAPEGPTHCVCVWDRVNGRMRWSVEWPTRVESIAYSRVGGSLLFACGGGLVRALAGKTGATQRTHDAQIGMEAFTGVAHKPGHIAVTSSHGVSLLGVATSADDVRLMDGVAADAVAICGSNVICACGTEVILLPSERSAGGSTERAKQRAVAVEQAAESAERTRLRDRLLASLRPPFPEVDWGEALRGDPSIAAHVDALTGDTLLHMAVRAGRAAAVAALLDATEADVCAANSDGCTPLHVAACSPFGEVALQMVRALLAKGGNRTLGLRSSGGRTPLHDASRTGNAAIVSELCQHLCDSPQLLNAEDESGATPLHLAVEWAPLPTDVVRILLENGANPYARCRRNRTAVDILRGKGDRNSAAATELESLLLDAMVRHRDASEWDVEWRRWLSERPGRGQRFEATTNDTEQATDDEPHVTAALRSVRTGTFSALDVVFETMRNPRGRLYAALGYLSLRACDAEDASESLCEYEEASEGLLHPLFVLAHGRLAARTSNPRRATALLGRFQRMHPSLARDWLTSEEKALVDPTAATATVHGEGGVSDGAIRADDPLLRRWEALRGSLTDDQKEPMDTLLRMQGLAGVKACALRVFADVLADSKLRKNGRASSVTPRTLNFAFAGNPGTGKTTVARLFARLLSAAGARAGHNFVSMTAQDALRMGARKFSEQLGALTGSSKAAAPPPSVRRVGAKVEVRFNDRWYPATVVQPQAGVGTVAPACIVQFPDGQEESVSEANLRIRATGNDRAGGVLFLDEAYDLDPKGNKEGREILSDIMAAAEDHRDTVTLILAGYKEDIESRLFAFNVGLASRFETITFDDFSEDELYRIWKSLCVANGWECAEDVCMVATRRVARGIGRKGFANARAVRRLHELAVSEAKLRYLEDAADGDAPRITMTDVIGEEPTRERNRPLDAALRELEGLTGLPAVKATVNSLVRLALTDYHKETRGERVDDVPLCRLFVGNPGTGKTTVAKLYGRVLRALRLLSNGEVVYRTASDFVGDVVGASQQKTRAILEMAQGKVLLIDEAYNLDDKMYGKQALDTIVEVVSGRPGEDIAVVLAGYEPQILKMLREQNPGLSRRFDAANPVRFADYSDDELLEMLAREVEKLQVRMPIAAKRAAVAKLARLRSLPNFGNAGALQSLLAEAKARMSDRVQRARNEGISLPMQLTREDVDRPEAGHEHPLDALSKLYGMDALHRRMTELGRRVVVRQKEGRGVAGIVGNWVFTGNAGTGKTTTARLFGRVLHGFGLLSRDHVEMTSATDLTGEYLGQTKEKVQKAMDAARGGVLFIDEAYLLGKNQYGEEALTKLLSLLTDADFDSGKTVVVLAGYAPHMRDMLARNPGVASRFTQHLVFPDWDADKCADFVLHKLTVAVQPTPYVLGDGSEHAREAIRAALVSGFRALSDPLREGWANVRDAERMASDIEAAREVRAARDQPEGAELAASTDGDCATITLDDVVCAVGCFIESRPLRTAGEMEKEQHAAVAFAGCVSSSALSDAARAVRDVASQNSTVTQARTDMVAQEDNAESEAGADVAKGAVPEEGRTSWVEEVMEMEWNGLNIAFELCQVNDALERLDMTSEEKLAALADGGAGEKELVAELERDGMDGAAGVVARYRKAWRDMREQRKRQEEERRRRLKEGQKTRVPIVRPIVQCQVCGRTGDFWAPCNVAPRQIGEKVVGYIENDVPVYE